MSTKRAFTMVELIFVIVILGILAAVAVPRLNASREDAELVKLATDIATLKKDILTYYTANGSLDASYEFNSKKYQDLRQISSVRADEYVKDLGAEAYFYVDGRRCIKLSAYESEKGVQMIEMAIYMRDFRKDKCKEFLQRPEVKQLFYGYPYRDYEDGDIWHNAVDTMLNESPSNAKAHTFLGESNIEF